MPYIPERRFEDKPDTYTPFFPMDEDNVVEVCDTNLTQPKKMQYNFTYIFLLVLSLFILYKNFK
jgi:predicted nucleic acid-binding Zn ribbon protein